MTYQTINPATGKLLKTYDDISDAALNEVMDVAQACYENDWRRRSVAQRAEVIHAVQRPGWMVASCTAPPAIGPRLAFVVSTTALPEPSDRR
jgi:hypothetical protein